MSAERNVKFCKTLDLSDKDDIVTIKEYVIKRMGEIISDAFFLMDMHLYVELCGCTNTRPILFNGYRGRQPSLLIIIEWKDAESDVWLDKKRLKEIPEEIKEVKITLQKLKGINCKASLIIPRDTIKAM